MLQVTKFAANHVEIEGFGKLDKADYDAVVPQLEEVAQDGKLRVLVKLDEFKGWTPRALVEELRFDLRHRRDFEKVAVVSDDRRLELGTRLTAPFFPGEIRFFEEVGAARAWLRT